MTDKSIYDRLADAQKSVKNPVSDSKGYGHGKDYGYSTLANVLDIVRPACNEQGLFLSQRLGGKRDDLHVITAVFCGKDHLVLDSFPLNYDANSQQFGSAVTYAKRYSLISVFGIASKDDDDDGLEGSRQTVKTQPAKQPAKPKKKPASKELCDAANKLKKSISEYASIIGGDAESMNDSVRKRPDFENTVEFYLNVASEFDQEVKNIQERVEF